MKVCIHILFMFFLCIGSGKAQDRDPNRDKYVIILDIQKHFTKNVIQEAEANQLLNTINSVIDTTYPSHIIYVKSVLTTLNISFKGVDVDTLPDLDFDERLKVVNGNIIVKNKANAFDSNALRDFLKQNSTTDIIVLGLMAEHCVYKTLLGGNDLGYHMYTIPNAIIGKSQKSKEKILTKLEKKGIKTIKANPDEIKNN